MLAHEPGRATGLGVDTGDYADWRTTFGTAGEDGAVAGHDHVRALVALPGDGRRASGVHAVGGGGREVDFVDGVHDFDLRGLGVGNGLESLRHEAVISSHDNHSDVGDIRSAGAHRREGSMTRSIEESEALQLARVGMGVLDGWMEDR
jgi:hypothetical protein